LQFDLQVGVSRIAILLALTFFLNDGVRALSQTSNDVDLLTIPADQARENLTTFVQPEYPPLAKAAHIAGIVRASFKVDETGSVMDLKLISGHPMLAAAALDAIRKWKYKPFVINGKPSAVRTEAQVSIPENITQLEIDKERKFQNDYWENERAGRAALDKGDLTTAEAKLSLAAAAAKERGDDKWMELADVMTMLGDVKERQKEYSTAEDLLKESLAIHRKHQRQDEAEVAGAEFNLAALYVQMQRFSEAEPLLMDAAKIWELRISDTPMPEAKADYGKHLALTYTGAARIAAESNRPADAKSRCQKAVSFAEQWPDQNTAAIKSACSSLTETH
jgi:TonB family protein